MCWNESVSLNTFIFSSFVLLLIVYNNLYTKYKIQELNNVWVYFFIASFVFIQLIEFFIWRNINNKFYNKFFSILATLLVILQPIFSIMMVTNIQIRNLLLLGYSLLAFPYSIYKLSIENIHSVIGKNGHLQWNYFNNTPIMWVIVAFIWLFFFLFSLFYERKYTMLIFGIVTLIISFINYMNNHTIWSMWCWSVNSIMIYYAFYLLVYLPFLEKASLC